MTDNNFEKEVSDLYQQRKAAINAPEVKLSPNKHTRYQRVIKPFVALFAGGFLSLATLAVMVHLIKQPEVNPDTVVIDTSIPAIIITLPQKDKTQQIETVELKKQPEVTPTPIHETVKPTHIEPVDVEEVELYSAEPIAVILPTMQQQVVNIQPIYQVMPKIKETTTGYIRLSYLINQQGKVFDVEVIDATVSNSVIRATKKALNKWRYPTEHQSEKKMEVIFEFNPQ